MSVSRFVAAVVVAVIAGLVLAHLIGALTYGVGVQLGYPAVDAEGYTALGGALISAAITLAACALAGGLWAARERKKHARVFLPRDLIVVVAVATPLFLLWPPMAAVVGLAAAAVFYGLGLAIGRLRVGKKAPPSHFTV